MQGRYGKPADLFSAGVVLFAAATQELPFEDEELRGHEEIAPPLADVGAKYAKILVGLLRWKPLDRFSAEPAFDLLRADAL